MENARYQIRRSKIFVAPQSSMGRKLPPRLFLPATDCLVRKPLSFHAVSFCSEWDSTIFSPARARPSFLYPSITHHDSLDSTLRKMVQLALEIQNEAPHDPLFPATARIPSSFTTALDTVSIQAPHTKKQANIPKGAARRDILQNRRVAEKDTGFITALISTSVVFGNCCNYVSPSLCKVDCKCTDSLTVILNLRPHHEVSVSHEDVGGGFFLYK